jgi:hypothetical protein
MRAGEPFLEDKEESIYTCSVPNVFLSECYVCDRLALGMGDRMLVPPARDAAAPHADMPPALARDFNEARTIVNLSPRGAAALLRLSIQKLCQELGEPGKDLNTDIGSLVKKGLPTQIQQALDAVRVVGNEAVHPGELDLKDDHDTAARLFDLVNMIVDECIAKPKRLHALFARIPENKRHGIAQRDAKKAT